MVLTMLDIITHTINQFYKEKDKEEFKALCKKPLELFEELEHYIEAQGLKSFWGPDDTCYPSKKWYVDLPDYKKGEFEVSYTTRLQISKVAPLFYIQHGFSVINKDEDKMTPVLRDADNQPYTKKQYALHDKISAVLAPKGYTELSYADMEETVEGFKMPEGVTIFGHNVTVELLLFVDLYNICGDE